jgi:hypothetical protein
MHEQKAEVGTRAAILIGPLWVVRWQC